MILKLIFLLFILIIIILSFYFFIKFFKKESFRIKQQKVHDKIRENRRNRKLATHIKMNSYEDSSEEIKEFIKN